jgi:protein involved in plasmid replication-relaxation
MNTVKPALPVGRQACRQARPILLTPRIEKILRAISFYRFMTARDLAHLLYSPSSLTHVREILASLSNAKYLYRFQLPHTSRGNTENVFVLGTRGREFLSSLGTQVAGYFRPYKVAHATRSQITHDLVLTRFCVAAAVWAAKQPDFKLKQTRICYELSRIDHFRLRFGALGT